MKQKNQLELTPDEYKEKVSTWLQRAKQRGSSHMIIVFDLVKKNPFPVYVNKDTNVQQKIKSFNDNDFVQAVEVYNLSMDTDAQLLQARAWNV